MQIASVPSRALFGIEAVEVNVEAHLSSGLPSFAIVGLPETAVKESKERVRSALINSGLSFPMERITVNLAPADLPKAGGRYDLAIAVAILIASQQLSARSSGQLVALLKDCEMVGELALNGELRPVSGVVQAALAAQSVGRPLLVPAANRAELRIVGYPLARAVASLTDLLRFATQLAEDQKTLFDENLTHEAVKDTCTNQEATSQYRPKFAPVRGQARALRALEIAAAGGHNLLMLGPPGSGKTLLATTLSKLLPQMSREEILEVASIRSAAVGSLSQGRALDLRSDCLERPLRAPHHSATMPALVGGGGDATPGEITLAHRGVLFLDELAEFKSSVLDALREPLEARVITLSRARYRVQFPANFQLVAAMNPCPCGYATDPQRECRCTPDRVRNYMGKVSGPLLDRFDLIIEVPALSHAELLAVGRSPIDEQPHSQAECQKEGQGAGKLVIKAASQGVRQGVKQSAKQGAKKIAGQGDRQNAEQEGEQEGKQEGKQRERQKEKQRNKHKEEQRNDRSTAQKSRRSGGDKYGQIADEEQAWENRRTLIAQCRVLQISRQGVLNCELSAEELEQACGLNNARKVKLAALFEDLGVSARGAHRVLRMARTVADFDGCGQVEDAHFLEAASYRRRSP